MNSQLPQAHFWRSVYGHARSIYLWHLWGKVLVIYGNPRPHHSFYPRVVGTDTALLDSKKYRKISGLLLLSEGSQMMIWFISIIRSFIFASCQILGMIHPRYKGVSQVCMKMHWAWYEGEVFFLWRRKKCFRNCLKLVSRVKVMVPNKCGSYWRGGVCLYMIGDSYQCEYIFLHQYYHESKDQGCRNMGTMGSRFLDKVVFG